MMAEFKSQAVASNEISGSNVDDLFGFPVVGNGREVTIDAFPLETTIDDPTTGELVPVDDVDALLECYGRVKAMNDRCYAVQLAIRNKLWAMTEGDNKTRRIVGRRHKAKLTQADDGWDNSILLEAFNAYPNLRDQCLKIGTIKVMAREFKKLVNTSGPADFEQFRNMVSKAHRGPSGTPALSLES